MTMDIKDRMGKAFMEYNSQLRIDSQRLQEIDDNLLKYVRNSSGRNPSQVEAEIRELEKV